MLPESFTSLFEKDLLAELSSYSVIRVPADTVIMDVGDEIRVMPIVLRGTVKVTRTDDDEKELLLYYITEQESCAMTFTCCMEAHTSEIRAVAEDDTELLAVPIEMMDRWLHQYPSWKHFVMNTIRTRFNELLRTVDMVAFHQMDERLVRYLAEKSSAHSSTLINLSHEQIAQELATSRVVVSRLLKKLENDGKLLLYRNQIKLLSAFFAE